jgi:hypothetical protein
LRTVISAAVDLKTAEAFEHLVLARSVRAGKRLTRSQVLRYVIERLVHEEVPTEAKA